VRKLGRLNRQAQVHVLPLMQDTDDVQPIAVVAKIDHLCAGGVFQVARAHVDRPALFDAGGQSLAGIPDVVGVAVGLICPSMLGAVGPDVIKVGTGGGREGKGLHRPSYSARFRALNASKSKGWGSPDCSPAIRASCRAFTLASCSSRSRSPARTTSLDEP